MSGVRHSRPAQHRRRRPLRRRRDRPENMPRPANHRPTQARRHRRPERRPSPRGRPLKERRQTGTEGSRATPGRAHPSGRAQQGARALVHTETKANGGRTPAKRESPRGKDKVRVKHNAVRRKTKQRRNTQHESRPVQHHKVTYPHKSRGRQPREYTSHEEDQITCRAPPQFLSHDCPKTRSGSRAQLW